MKIERVDIENFRCIREESIGFSSITAFLGRNGAGKSTLLYALDSFYNVAAQYSNLDYYGHQTDGVTIKIRVTFSDLMEDEIEEFGGYVHEGKLVVTKAITTGGVRYLGVSRQIPDFAELRTLGVRDRRQRLVELVQAGALPDFPPVPARGEEVDRAMEVYEQQRPELTELVEREGTFFGPKNIGGGKLDKYTKFVLVPAVRDASSEMERRGAVMQLLELIVSRSIANRADFLEFKEQFEQRARALYGKENLPELAELGGLVTRRLSKYAPGASLSVDFDELKAPAIPLPNAVVEIAEDEFPVPVRYTGHGLQRALILALLEQLSLTENSNEQKKIEADGAGEQRGNRSPGLILAIEEPELYLHPARSRYLSKVLRTLARENELDATSGAQIMCVSHSPYFVSVQNFDEVRVCRKIRDAAALPPATRISGFTRLEAAQSLASIYQRNKEEFTEASFVARATPVLNSIVNEGLFADAVVVVEGDSDVAALWAVQEHLGLQWDEKGVVVVPVGGKNNIDRAVVVFRGFGIPTYFLFDGDKTEKDAGIEANKALLALGGLDRADFPTQGVYDSCAAFENNLEEYLESVVGDGFDRLRSASALQCGHDRPSKALKNSEVMAAFLVNASNEGHRFDLLENLVRRVSDLL